MLLTSLIVLAFICLLISKLSAGLALFVGLIGLLAMSYLFKDSPNDEATNFGVLFVFLTVVSLIAQAT
jgi:hypothetical protein